MKNLVMEVQGDLVVRQQRFAVLVSRFNEFITSKLQTAAVETLKHHGCSESNITTVWVTGAFELPLIAKKLAVSGNYDAIIALGCIIRGDTPHFEYISSECARGLSQAALDCGIPVIFGVLTVHTVEQAMERAGDGPGNKGAEAALTAIEMTNLIDRLKAKNM